MDSLAKLQIFAIGGCRIIGEIPTWLIKLKSLELMDLSQNGLVGSIPTGSQFDTFRKSYFEGNPLLCGGVLQTSCAAPTRPPATRSTTTENDELKRTLVIGSAIGYLFGFSSILFVCAWRDRRSIVAQRRIIQRRACCCLINEVHLEVKLFLFLEFEFLPAIGILRVRQSRRTSME
ncbi:unnamed protein product [Brassica rapa subsp. narinosa]